jgi:hypothetical protein
VAQWPVSGLSNPPPTILGVSWSAVDDQLIATYTNSSTAGVQISAYDVAAGLRSAIWTPLWTIAAPDCTYPLNASYGTGAAYRSQLQPALFVPCSLSLVPQGSNADKDGVVKVKLVTRSASDLTCHSNLCPDVTSAAAAIAPGAVNGFTFDPGSDRGFSTAVFGQYTDVLVYDGHHDSSGDHNEFIGNFSVAPSGNIALGLDRQTGRVYVYGADGLTLIDGRRTPVAPGQRVAQFHGAIDYISYDPLPADSAYPYARFPVPVSGVSPQGGATWPYFQILADRVGVGVDPPPGLVDRNTLPSVPSGATPSKTYGANARGYGVHSDSVLSYFGRSLPTDHVPFASGNRDLLAAEVERLSASDGSAQGTAAAMRAGDTGTSRDYDKNTNNAWPYPAATCSSPGPQPTGTREGAYYGDPNKDPQQVADTMSLGKAHVDCAYQGGALGEAYYNGSSGGYPPVRLGEHRHLVRPGNPH